MTGPTRRALLVGLAGLPLAGISSFEALFAPRADLWDRWTRHDPASTARIDHATWAAFLARYVRPSDDGINRVAYGEVTAADRGALEGYLAALAAAPVDTLNRDQQMAFWINLYNALTVGLILEYAPRESIRDIDISPGLFSDGPWGRKLARVAGEEVSLNDIEHRILRPIWRDPRVHYAVNCASLGCPNLWPEPYRAEDLSARLDAAARAYVNHPRGARVRDGRLIVSSIYVWFGGDFGGEAGVLAHLRDHADEGLLQDMAPITGISDHGYDWSLNAAGRGS